jgi:RHS repeat-associated protein
VTSNAFYHADGNGNIVAMVNNTPALVASYKYDPFGRTLASGGSLSAANVMQFSSKMLIQTGLGYGPNIYYYGYRFYDPQTQRWLNKDPLGDPGSLAVASAAFAPWIDLASPNGATTDESMSVWTQVNRNLFGALGNNPISQIDPDGLFLGNIAMGLLGGGVDLGFQLLLNGGRWDCVSWTSVGISAVATGAGYGIGGTVAKLGKLGRAARVLEKAREKTGPLTNYMKGQVAQAMAARKAAAGGVAGFAASQAFKHAAKAAEKSLTDPPNGIGGNGKAPCP